MSQEGFLRSSYLFRHLPPARLSEVQNRLALRDLAAGEILFNQGEPGDQLFIVHQGCVAIFAPSATEAGREKPIRLFRPGDVLGEMALIDRQPRSLSARAEQPSRLLVLDGQEFRRLIDDDPEIALAAMSGLSDRIRYTTDFITRMRHWIEHMSAGRYQAEEFQAQIAAWAGEAGAPGAPAEGSGAAAERDETLSALAAEFVQMAVRVREREEALKRQVEQLRIEIDMAKRERQVSEIVDSEFFANLKSRAASLRQKRLSSSSDEDAPAGQEPPQSV